MATSTTTAPTVLAPATAPGDGPLRATPKFSRRVPVAVAVLALAAALVTAVTRAGDDATSTGSTPLVAPTFSLEGVRDPTARVTLGAGGQPVVLNFFAAWCVPCRAELPVLQQASERLAGTVGFVGVDVSDSRTAATELLERTGVTFPAGYDPDRKVASSYRVQGMPTTVFVDARGRVAEVARGRLTPSELDQRVDRLIAASPVGREGP